MKEKNRTSIAALALSGAALLVVLVSPTPKAPERAASRPTERVTLGVRAEDNAFRQDWLAFDAIIKRAKYLGGGDERRREEAARLIEAVDRLVIQETGKLWRDFNKKMSILDEYEKHGKGEPPIDADVRR